MQCRESGVNLHLPQMLPLGSQQEKLKKDCYYLQQLGDKMVAILFAFLSTIVMNQNVLISSTRCLTNKHVCNR